MKRSRIAAALLAGTAALIASPAFAVDTGLHSDDIDVSLTIVDECTLLTEPLLFDTSGIIDENVDTTADLVIECTKGSAYAIGLSAGANAGVEDDVTTRRLKNGTETLDYDLYSNPGYSTVWGETKGVNTVDAETSTGGNETHIIYARVPTHQNVPIGTYTDTITATIWYGDDLP